jgi:hypothetical protein
MTALDAARSVPAHRRAALAAACVALALAFTALLAPSAQASFGFQNFELSATQAPPPGSPLGVLGPAATQAGSHPYAFTTAFKLNRSLGLGGRQIPDGDAKDVEVELPPGLVGDPGATPKCTIEQFNTPSHLAGGLSGASCPNDTQVGVVQAEVTTSGLGEPVPLTLGIYNLVSPPGVPAEFGFNTIGVPVIFTPRVRIGGDYGLTVSSLHTNQTLRIFGARATLWGIPADPSHDGFRGQCLGQLGESLADDCSVEIPVKPFLRLPTSCPAGPLGEPLPFAATIHADSWQEPVADVGSKGVSAQAFNESQGHPVGIDGCGRLDFSPTISLAPDTAATDSPAGLHVDLHLPQDESPESPSEADLRDATVTLPAGMTINPSSANGLAACTPAQVGLTSAPGASPATYSSAPAACPDAAKIGTVEVDTPLLEHPLYGAVYVAQPFANPFDSLLAIYIAIDDPQSGIVVKLAGHVEADPATGRLTTRFEENPQLPFEDFKLDFFGGRGAALRTPPTCASFTTVADLTPWSSPEAPDATPSSAFSLSSGPNGSACASKPAQSPLNPGFLAKTADPTGGAFSPFFFQLTRVDGEQELRSIETTLPPGLLGRLAGVAECFDAQLIAAEQHSGRDEQQSPSCPLASEVGKVTVGAGAGPDPYYVTGHAYLAGPYRGAPLSLAILTPAVAGPYDLGTVVVRTALHVDPSTAQIHAVSDPIPQILDGIPLDLRSILLSLDRNQFTLNPTNCGAMAVGAEAFGSEGATAALSDHFQAADCAGLGFKPNLSIQFMGAIHRRAHPKLIATLKPRPGDANISFAQVKLPKAAFLDNAHIGAVCTRVQFVAEQCPAGSIYGKAQATTPLLDYTLNGTVYLRSSEHQLPDLVVAFKGPDYQPIKFVLAGKTDSVKGALRNTFEYAPDVPVSKFRLELFGGKQGLVILSNGLCAHRNATLKFRGHNGKEYEASPKVKADCGVKGGKKSHRSGSVGPR